MIDRVRKRLSTPPRSLVILSIMLAASFRVSSAVRVRLCKRMELRHVPRERHLACMRPAIALCRAAISGHHSLHFPPTTQEGLASTPAHRRQSFIGLFVWTRLISSDRCCHSILHARTAPQSTPLPLSSVCTSATRQAPPSRQTRQYTSISPCNNCPASIAIYRSSARLQQ